MYYVGLYSFDFMGGYCCTNGYSFTHLFEIDKKFYNVANDQLSFLYSGYFEWNYDGQIQHRAKLDSGNI